MAEDTQAAPEDAPKKKSKLPLIIGLVLMLAGGGGGFVVMYSGMLGADRTATEHAEPSALPDIGFVPVEPIFVNLAPGAKSDHLRFSAQIEVAKPYEAEVAMLMPRIQDVLNGYLRAVAVSELEDPAALIRLRAQILRRVQMVTGEGRVRDFLVTEFVLN
ncbi:MAG: flagellar basal body-associated FliL family protein [Paracoccaceae bacterium]